MPKRQAKPQNPDKASAGKTHPLPASLADEKHPQNKTQETATQKLIFRNAKDRLSHPDSSSFTSPHMRHMQMADNQPLAKSATRIAKSSGKAYPYTAGNTT